MISSVTSQLEEKAAHTEPQEQDLEIKETGLQVEVSSFPSSVLEQS